MRQYDASNLIVHPGGAPDPDVVVEVTPERAGWETIHFQVRRLGQGRAWSFATGEHELALVVLGGRVGVEAGRGSWAGIGQRRDVFAGLPSALYLPRRTDFAVTAETDAEFAVAWVATDRDHPPRLVGPADVTTEIRGGDTATRQINDIIPPGFPCHRLVVVEVYTPGGGWSSYPPHKHDVHTTGVDGTLREADLDEIYYYKLDRPEGFALQRVYTDPASPLHRAGFPIDAALVVRTDDVVLVPEGYHPVASPPGYTTYYLNVLAGSAQSLANRDDPAHAWVKEMYRTRDPRVPIYDLADRT
jgi:5-deoxy-glucuronate isomerase